MSPSPFTPRNVFRQALEFAIISCVGWGTYWVVQQSWLSPQGVCWLITALAVGKTLFFLGENLHQLLVATTRNALYHRFMGLMLVNMTQIALSFGLDFWCLHSAMPTSFTGIPEGLQGAELIFEHCYFSFLNITYFGYGEVMPFTVQAKLVTMMELLIAFFTVIFLLSDFISLKEAILKDHE
jgi:hypothetical protein